MPKPDAKPAWKACLLRCQTACQSLAEKLKEDTKAWMKSTCSFWESLISNWESFISNKYQVSTSKWDKSGSPQFLHRQSPQNQPAKNHLVKWHLVHTWPFVFLSFFLSFFLSLFLQTAMQADVFFCSLALVVTLVSRISAPSTVSPHFPGEYIYDNSISSKSGFLFNISKLGDTWWHSKLPGGHSSPQARFLTTPTALGGPLSQEAPAEDAFGPHYANIPWVQWVGRSLQHHPKGQKG